MKLKSWPFLNMSVIISLVLLIVFWYFSGSERLQFWLGLATGNWFPPKDFNIITEIEFSSSVYLAILINLSPLLGAWGLIYGWLRPALVRDLEYERSKIMKLRHAFVVAGLTAKLEVKKRFSDDPDALRMIDEAFDESLETWKEYLAAAFSEEDARALFQQLDQEIQSPTPA